MFPQNLWSRIKRLHLSYLHPSNRNLEHGDDGSHHPTPHSSRTEGHRSSSATQTGVQQLVGSPARSSLLSERLVAKFQIKLRDSRKRSPPASWEKRRRFGRVSPQSNRRNPQASCLCRETIVLFLFEATNVCNRSILMVDGACFIGETAQPPSLRCQGCFHPSHQHVN